MDLTTSNRHPASFRDPAAVVFSKDGKIIRGLTAEAAKTYLAVKETGLLQTLEQQGKIITSLAFNPSHPHPHYSYYLEHNVIPFISYPYEWPFALLKKAALLHLDIQLQAIDKNIVLADASAYNIQFLGINPVFIDILSFRPYKEGELWAAHNQFCEHFLNPLLLTALKKVPYQDWYRGAFEGIPTACLAQLLPVKSWFSLRALTHVLLPAWCQKSSDKAKEKTTKEVSTASIPITVYKNFLQQLHSWITNLQVKHTGPTLWENYTNTRLYETDEVLTKKRFVADFVSTVQPNQLWDLGCNDGEFAELALQNGATSVIGFDVDLGALENAVLRAKTNNLNYLPLYQQITNPSPNQGWLLQERCSITHRGNPDAVIALAFIHHLALGHNIPLAEIVAWLVSLAPQGVIEFVHKTDPTAQKMLTLKGDIFPFYTEAIFLESLQRHANVIKFEVISKSGRCLYWYKRKT